MAEDLFRFSAEKTLDPGSEAERGVLELLEQQLLRAEKKLKRLYSLYSEGEDEALRETVAEQKKETAAIREKLELEKNRKALSKRRKKTLDRISSLKEVWHVMTPMEKRAVVDQVIERVVVTGQTLQIEYKL